MRELTDACPSRRTLLRSLAAVGGVALFPGVLAGCASGGGGTGTPAVNTVAVSDVPVGRARVVDVAGERLVVAQPSAGEFVAFSSRCTHQGAQVEAGNGLTLTCPNHGSQFDATDGKVLRGPAESALPSVPLRVEGDRLVVG